MMGHLRQRPYRARGFVRLEELERRDTPSSVTENFDGSTGGLPAGWDQWASAGGPAFARTAVTGTSTAPNALVDSAISTVTARAWSTTALAANVTAAADVWVQDPNAVAHVFARGSSLNNTTPTYYAATITRATGGPSVNVIKVVNGTPTGLATPVTTASYVSGLWLGVTLDVQGTTVRASVQRVSDGYYLNTSGTWQQAQVWAVSATDSSITAGGHVGIAQPSGSSGTRQFDTFAATDSQTSGSTTENFDTTTVGNQPTGWGSYTSDTANPNAVFKVASGTAYSGSNGYAVTPVTTTAVIRSWLNTSQPADQTVSAMQYLTGLAPGQVIARGNFLNTPDPEFYALAMNRDGDITLQRAKRDAGGITQYTNLGSLDIGYHNGIWVKMTVEAVGNQLQAQIYRPGTNQYLNGSGTWQSAPVYVFSVTDTGLPAGGYAGVGRPNSYATTVTFDDFSVTTASQPADATVSFDATSFAVTEQEGSAKVTLVLSEPLDYRVDVVYSSEAGAGAGAATANSDFVIKSDTVTFAPGQTERTVILPVKWDGVSDPGEFFNARIGAITADGTVTVSGPAVVPVNITDSARTGTTAIDSGWLANNNNRLNSADSSSPYKLSSANTTYVLESDVNAPNTAFVVTAAGVNLNLNWHTVNYDTVSIPDVPNGGFESPLSATTNWDVTGAPAATRESAAGVADFAQWGDWVLKLTNITAAQTLKSKPVNIQGQAFNRNFAATVTPLATAGAAKVEVTVKATKTTGSTEYVVGSYSPPTNSETLDAQKAYSPTAFLSLGTATDWKEMWMEVKVTPVGGAATVYLDYAALTTAWNYGIFASRWYTTDPTNNIPTHLTAAGLTAAQAPHNFTLRNGSVLQTGKSYEGHALYFRRLWSGSSEGSNPTGNGFTVDAVTTKVNGTDGRNLMSQYAKNITIKDSTFDSAVDRVRRRTAVNAAVSIGDQAFGSLTVVNNVVKNVPQAGIDVSRHRGGAPGRNLVTDNLVTTRGVVTNGYGLKIYGLQNFTVARNAVFAENGRGLLVEGDQDAPDDIDIIDGDFTDNYVEVYETPNFEYSAAELQTPALRVRNYDSPLRNLTFKGNTFVSRTDAAGAQGADGTRITLSNKNTTEYPLGTMTGANIRFEGNHFKGIVDNATGAGFHAHAVSLTAVPAGTGLEFWNNTFESNYQALNLGNNRDGQGTISGVLFGRNTFQKTTEGGDRPDFRAISVGEHSLAVTNVRIVSPTFAGGLSSAFGSNLFFSGTATKETRFGHTVDVRVRNGSGAPIAGATVDWLDNGVVKDTWTTDATGDVRVPVITTTYNSVPANPTQFTTTSGGPFRVRATYNSVTQFEDYSSLTADVVEDFVF
jgi:hypothetical protein